MHEKKPGANLAISECNYTRFASHTYFLRVTIASFLEIIAILGQDSSRANEITDPQKCSKSHMAIEMAAASISAACYFHAIFPMQPNYLAMASCVTVKSKQSGRVLGESWAVWATKHMTFHGRIF